MNLFFWIIGIIFMIFVFYSGVQGDKHRAENPHKYAPCQYSYKNIDGEEFECIECYSNVSNRYGITCNFNGPRG